MEDKEYYLNKLEQLKNEMNIIENNLSKLFKWLISLLCISGFALILVPFILKIFK